VSQIGRRGIGFQPILKSHGQGYRRHVQAYYAVGRGLGTGLVVGVGVGRGVALGVAIGVGVGVPPPAGA